MRIAIGSDHAGFALKEGVKVFLTAEDREIVDLGIYSTDRSTIPTTRADTFRA